MAEEKKEIVKIIKKETFKVINEFTFDKLYKSGSPIELSDKKIIEKLKTNKFIK